MYMLTRTYIYCHKKSIFSLIALLVLQSYNVTISIDDFQQNMYNIYIISISLTFLVVQLYEIMSI